MNRLLVVLLICFSVSAYSQNGVFTTLNLNGYKLVGVSNVLGSDSLSVDKIPTMKLLYTMMKDNYTDLYFGTGFLGTGKSTDKLRIDYDNVIERLTATQIMAKPRITGKLYYNKSSNHFIFWNGTAYRQFSEQAAQ